MTIEECRNNIARCERQLPGYYACNRQNNAQIDELNYMRSKLINMREQMEQAATLSVSKMNSITSLFGICARKVSSLFNDTENIYKGNEYKKAYMSIENAIGKVDGQIHQLYRDIEYNNNGIRNLENSIDYYRRMLIQLEAE